MKKASYALEAAALWCAFILFRLLGPRAASGLGGFIGRTIGPRLATSRKAANNLAQAMPNLTAAQSHTIIKDMWDNLGRVIAEYPHLKTIILNHTEIAGEDNLTSIGPGNGCIIIGGHLANWELFPFYFNYRIDWPIAGIYRAPNNPYVDKLLDKCRNPEDKGSYIPKSAGGARAMVKEIAAGGRVGILIDQKYNQGLAAPFFGKLAMTSAAFAQMAEKYKCPILPLQVERVNGCNFRITLHKPFHTEGRAEIDVVAQAHKLLESWIEKNPGQWLWLHRRWDSKALKEMDQAARSDIAA